MALLNLSCGRVFLVLRGGTELPPPLPPAAQSLPSHRSGGSNLLAVGICAQPRAGRSRSRSRWFPEPRGHPLAWSPGTRGHRLPPTPLRGEPGEAALEAVWPGWQRQARGTLQLCIPVSDKGLALLRMNSLSPRPLSRKCHPPASPCVAESPPGFVTLLRESIVRTSLCRLRTGRASSALWGIK